MITKAVNLLEEVRARLMNWDITLAIKKIDRALAELKKKDDCEKDVLKYIKKVCKDGDNFIYDNYGSESWDNGEYELSYSKSNAEKTMLNFYHWLKINRRLK